MVKIDEVEENDMKCPLCMEFMIKPISLPCTHNFCTYCLETSLIYNPSCPLCRKEVNESLNNIISEKNINKALQEKIATSCDSEMLKNREEMILKERSKSRNLIIEYG
ncbi:RING-HC finger protein, partial [uncultured Flavobacterium sp.]|uniref:RING-HC finger protein n=1 Tax=uncultured Flavobacterium sp. TaxID=165435 RepID=UPI0025976806